MNEKLLAKLKQIYIWLDNFAPDIFIYNGFDMLKVTDYLSDEQIYHLCSIMASYVKEAIEDLKEATE